MSGAEARLRQELAARGEAERRNRDLEQQRRASTQALREARRSAPAAAAAPDLDARRARWGADDAWVRHEMYLAWVDRVDAADRAAWPLRDFVVGSEFAASLRSLDTGQFEKALRAAVDAVTGRIRHLPAREAHPLRTGDGAGDPDTVRASDGAKCWRAYIEQKTPAARRIHYWALPGGGVELSRIVTHDDVEP